MQLSNREKILLSLLGIVGILGLGMRFLVLPAAERYQENQQQLIAVQDEQIRINSLLAQEQGLSQRKNQALLDANKVSRPYFVPILPERIDYWLNHMEKETGVKYSVLGISEQGVLAPSLYSSIQPQHSLPIWEFYDQFGQAPRNPRKPVEIEGQADSATDSEQAVVNDLVLATTLDLQLTGTYTQVMNFLDELSGNEKRVDINNFSMIPESEQEVIDIIFHPPTEEGGEVIVEEITRPIATGKMSVIMKATIYSVPKDGDTTLNYNMPNSPGQKNIM